MRKYTVGINVHNADELEGMGRKLRAFFDDIGEETEIDVQVSVNPLLTEGGEPAQAIGFIYDGDSEDDEDYYEEDAEDDDE